jgi:uncharacterized membrane protein YcaP (DUF421 family)
MLTSGSVLLQIVIRTSIIYVFILIGVRLAGKREVGQMTPFDLVLLLLLSNSVQNAMTGSDTSLIGGIVAALTLFLLNRLVGGYSGTNRRFRKIIQGSPTMIIHNGDVLLDHMAKEHLSMDELERALREHGIGSPTDVSIGVLEVDGSISFLKFDDVPVSAQIHKRTKFLRRNP